ncbi:MAG TPA: HGGxSTG domain-containing protein [Candidatus Dormibacteraeota bacterium]|nr:HGGxSTG domain-containing protein [Candidatus Dormibacteraeota bacterium]
MTTLSGGGGLGASPAPRPMKRRLCGAKKRDGATCTMQAMKGQERCRMHGGKTPAHMAAAKRRLAEQAALRVVQREGIVPIGDPIEMLRQLSAEAVALKDFFNDRLKALEELRYQSGAGEQLRAEVALYERALDRSQRFLHDLARLGLDERTAKLDEAKVVLLVSVLERVLASPDLALDAGRQARGRELLAEALES